VGIGEKTQLMTSEIRRLLLAILKSEANYLTNVWRVLQWSTTGAAYYQ